MAIPKIEGAQRDFSAGEVDVTMKRADEHPLMKTGARQCANWRILNSRALQNRPGRRALFGGLAGGGRVDEITMSPGNTFYLAFGTGVLLVYNAAGAVVFTTTKKGDGVTSIPWTAATVASIVWARAGLAIYICYGDGAPANVPQVLTWDGVSTWTLATYAVENRGLLRRTPFYRISPKGITMAVAAQNGSTQSAVSAAVTFSAPVLTSAHVLTMFRFGIFGQCLITAVTSPTAGIANVIGVSGTEINFTTNPAAAFNIGDELVGATSGAKVVVSSFPAGGNLVAAADLIFTGIVAGETMVGPNGSAVVSSTVGINAPAIVVWDDEVMNSQLRGWPTSCFYDQGRLGFCNFPSVPGLIAWGAIGDPSDQYTDQNNALADNAIQEIAPGNSQVLYVQGGMESSEFVFCSNAIHYIPITAANPLAPGSVAFNQLSQQGSAAVQPRAAEQSIVYVKAGGKQIGAVQVPGAYYRPDVVDTISELHAHLFNSPVAIAVPSGSTQFEETYLYVLNADGTLAVGKYLMRNGLIDAGPDGKPHVGWVPWSGAGTVKWVGANGADTIFTTAYAPNGAATTTIVEVVDNTQYLDGALLVNSLPAPFTPPGGKGPLYVFPGPNSSVTLMDQVTRMMGTYLVDANGNIIPQNNGGENLSAASLVAGQPWTATLEPFVPDAAPGQDVHQRMFKRRVSRMAAYVSQSSGFLMARLFAGPLTRTSPTLGTVMNFRRVDTWNQDDDPTQAPPLREEAQRWRPLGRAFDPRVAIIKDTPGPLIVHEIGIEASI